MVFENVTLFEVHLEDARFGPNLGEDGTTDEAGESHAVDANEATDESSGPSIGRLIAASVVVSIVVALVARKLAGDDDPDVDIDAPEDPIDVSVED